MSSYDRNGQGTEEPHGVGRWIGALILIAVGVVFLFQNMGYRIPGNWWALFLLIPAVAAFGGAWKTYQQNGRQFDAAVFGAVLTGLVLLALTVVFLLDADVDWGLIWPIVLIVIGIVGLGRVFWRT